MVPRMRIECQAKIEEIKRSGNHENAVPLKDVRLLVTKEKGEREALGTEESTLFRRYQTCQE